MAKHTMKIDPVKLKAAIRSKYLTVKGVARKLDVNLGTFRSYLSGQSDMPFLLIEACADLLDIEPDELYLANQGMEWEIRQSLLGYFHESEFKRLAGDREDLFHLKVIKDVVPFLIAKKGTVFTAVDPKEIAQVMIQSRENIKAGGSATDGMSEDEVDLFNLLEDVDIEEHVSNARDESATDSDIEGDI